MCVCVCVCVFVCVCPYVLVYRIIILFVCLGVYIYVLCKFNTVLAESLTEEQQKLQDLQLNEFRKKGGRYEETELNNPIFTIKKK